jgi:predicted transcriptional regulator
VAKTGTVLFTNRSRMDIAACLLTKAAERTRKTRLIYGCNLSVGQFKVYARFLIRKGLLRRERGRDAKVYFVTTEKGLEFIAEYTKLKALLR